MPEAGSLENQRQPDVLCPPPTPPPPPGTKPQGWGPGTEALQWASSGSEGRAWAPESRRRGRVTHQGGRPGPSCLQSQGGDRVEADGSRSREEGTADAGGERLPEAPWTRGGAGGGWTLCRRKKGCRGGSRGQERGGEGAGQLLRPGEEGGGGREGGCPTADTHTGDSRLARSAELREAWGAAGCRGGSRQGRPPICLFYPTRVACRKQRALRVGSHQLPGLGTWCSKRACGQTPGRTSWTGKGDRETPFPLVDLWAEVISPLGVSRENWGQGSRGPSIKTWVGEGDCRHTHAHTQERTLSLSLH